MPTTVTARVGAGKVRTVLVVGASGFLGRSVVRALATAGYEVRGLVRDPLKGARVQEEGGIPIVGDILDVASLRRAGAGCSAVIHLAANPPVGGDPTKVRVEGTRNLAEVSRQEGIARLVIGSGYWVYRGRTDLIKEDSPVEPRGEAQINYDTERAGLDANSTGGLEVLVVRPGMVYGNGSWFGGLAESIRAEEYQVVGEGTNRWSFIDRWDAGTAFQTVLESGTAGEVYNVVDGHPAPLREFVDFVAAELGTLPPRSLPLEEAVRQMDDAVARNLAADRPTSNAKLRELGWKPQVSSYRDGIPGLLRQMFPGDETAL
jgi:nucleoside-diphosphate-sugar epimerase